MTVLGNASARPSPHEVRGSHASTRRNCGGALARSPPDAESPGSRGRGQVPRTPAAAGAHDARTRPGEPASPRSRAQARSLPPPPPQGPALPKTQASGLTPNSLPLRTRRDRPVGRSLRACLARRSERPAPWLTTRALRCMLATGGRSCPSPSGRPAHRVPVQSVSLASRRCAPPRTRSSRPCPSKRGSPDGAGLRRGCLEVASARSTQRARQAPHPEPRPSAAAAERTFSLLQQALTGRWGSRIWPLAGLSGVQRGLSTVLSGALGKPRPAGLFCVSRRGRRGVGCPRVIV